MVAITDDDDANTKNDGRSWTSDGGANTLTLTVTAEDTSVTETYTITVTRERDPTQPVSLPVIWSLIPSGLSDGDQFRLLFLSGTRRDGSSSVITDYNTFVRIRAAAGHTDIQAYSDGFMAVGCTEAVDARDNTGTTYTSTDKGVPIYWLDGNKVADDYEDFYDGSWDDEANDKNEDGNNGPNTSDSANYPLTGCSADGTEKISATVSSALGNGGDVTVARPNSSGSGDGPLSSSEKTDKTFTRPMYALSQVFTVTEPADCPTDATWCTSMLVRNTTTTTSIAKYDFSGYNITEGSGTLGSTTFTHESTSYTINRLQQTTLTALPANTISLRNFYLKAEPALPAGTILTLGDRSFTVGVESENPTAGQEEWDTIDNPLNWTNRQEVTVSLKIPPDATLSNIVIEGTAEGQTVVLSPAFDDDTLTYTARVGNGIDEVTLTATKNESNATVVITNDNETRTPDTADLDLSVGSNTLVVTVTAMDTTTTATLTYTITVTRAESGSAMLVPGDWSLIPTGLSVGDSFRLLFLSSTRHDASSASIDTYNTFVQGRAANGHTDIQAYSDGFTVVGCTAAVDARDNTSTRHDSADRGVPIYWLNGNKVADEYQDFYDGSWDDEANDKNQSGNNGPNTSDNEYYPLTGCDHNGTEKLNSALGSSGVTVARPNSTDSGHGPLSSGFQLPSANTRPMYGLSAVFTVTDLSDATLSSLDLIGTIGGESITLSPAFRNNTFTYTALVANGIDAVTLTATKNESNATVAITGDADTSTPNEAELHLDVGDNTLTVTVTADDTITTETYTVTVTRAEPTPVTTVPASWSLIPSGLGDGDQFRLIFLSSTKTVATSTNITDYNTFIQNLATAGHTDIQGYSDGFNVVGCTEDDDARNNTETSFNSTNKGVPIYWLNGNQVADDYEDFYDGSWDDEAADKDESGNNGPDTNQPANYPFTGCIDNGTQASAAGSSIALGNASVGVGIPDGSNSTDGPIYAAAISGKTIERPFYGLSEVFEVAPDATLSNLAIEGTPSGQTVVLNPTFAAGTFTYTAAVGYEIDEVTLTATTSHSDATVVITDDSDASTPNTADLGLNVGDNTLAVTVTVNDGNTETYTVTVTRNIFRPEPTPVFTTWSLIPNGLSTGDEFRLIFLSSTKRSASSSTIGDYNTFVQTRAAAGHADIQAYSSGFRAVGCTVDDDARDNTGTTFTSSDKGVPIYWLGGNKVADQYQDFYDETWDDEANDKNELGNNGPDTSLSSNYPWTGCKHNGTEAFPGSGFVSAALGQGLTTPGVPNSSFANDGPIGSNTTVNASTNRPMYGLSEVFQVVTTTYVSNLEQTPQTTSETASRYAQTFTTGSHPQYVLSGVDLGSGGGDVSVDIYEINTHGFPTTIKHSMTAPPSFMESPLKFVAPDNATLDGNTTYSVVITPLSGNFTYLLTASDDEDTAESGWSIANFSYIEVPDPDTGTLLWRADFSGNSLKIAIRNEPPTEPDAPTVVPAHWGLIPTGLTTGDQFRLIFLSSTKRDGSPSDIATYNTFIQDIAASGHTKIQAYSSGFRTVGCTDSDDARDNTKTTGTDVPIYWLAGTKVADDYADFYDGSWDDEVNHKNELGANGPDTSQVANYPLTGCDHDGTADSTNTLGATSSVRVGRPNSSNSGNGPLSNTSATATPSDNRPMYGLSQVFQVGTTTYVSNLEQTPQTTVDTAGRYSQTFTTGSHPQYVFSGADLGSGGAAGTVAVDIYETNTHGFPTTIKHSMTAPPSFTESPLKFVAPANATLDGGTTYAIIVTPMAGNFTYLLTTSNNEETAEPGWSIDDFSYIEVLDPDTGLFKWTADFSGTSLKIAIKNEPPTKPDAPTGLMANAKGTNEIALSWNAPANIGRAAISGYKIEHSPDGNSNWTNITSNTGNADTEYSNTGLDPETTRYYRVFAINSAGTSDASNIASATTTAVPLDRVTGVTVTPSDGTLSVTWATVSDATGYKVRWKSSGQSYNTSDREALITSGSTTNYVISGLNNGTQYSVRVVATKTGANDGPPSLEMTGTPSPIAPSVSFGPGSFTASENGATARVTVELSVPASVTIPLRVQHRNGASSADYSGVPRRLIFQAGQTIRSFTVTAVDDSDNDDDEKISIEFKDLPAGFQAGARSSITVKLKDNGGGNSLPLFDPANELRNLVENTAANQDVGLPITATDADGDSLTYTFDGPDMDRFTFVPATAQLRTKSGQTYDYETHQLFVVQVTADDGNGGTKTATVVIRVRDVAEPPQEPTGLTLVRAYPTSMALSWTAPDNTGRPAITGYDLQFKKSNESAWTDGPQGLTDTSDSITGLDPSTSYNIQVRANNDEGNGPWSSTLSRSTPSSSPGISITRTNLTMTEGDQTGRIYLIVLGSEPTADVHVYFSGYDATTVAPHNRSKTFNTGNWDAPRQVTLRAIEDADTTDETVTITHRVESEDADYEGITVPDLTVNVIDNDTPQVTGVWTQPGDRQLTVNWTATDKATGYKVQWKAPGDNYNTYGRMATITNGSNTSYTIPNLTNGTEYTVLVTATWTGHSDGQASDAVTGTPTATP